MIEPYHLDKAPVSEALIDVRVTPRDPSETPDFQAIKNEVGALYPDSSPIHYGQAAISFGTPPQARITTEDLGIQGYVFKSSTGNELVQLRRDGFTFNKLKPY